MSFAKLTTKETSNMILSELIKSINLTSGKALDLGAGSLLESKFLLSVGYSVDAVDVDTVSESFSREIHDDKFKFFKTKIEDFDFKDEEYDIVVSLLTLSFISPDNFDKVFNAICGSLKRGGYTHLSFFGDRDAWAVTQQKMTFPTREKVENLLKDFKIIQFREEDKIGPTVRGDIKKWHIYNIVAQKL